MAADITVNAQTVPATRRRTPAFGLSWRILGAAIAAPQAGELIQPWCLAISRRLKISALASFVPPYPTLGEASKRAAGSYFTEALFGSRTRKLVRFLARLPVW